VYRVVAVVALGFDCPRTLYDVAIGYAPIVISAVGVESGVGIAAIAALTSESVARAVAEPANVAKSLALLISMLP
jgi:hypothetical protein